MKKFTSVRAVEGFRSRTAQSGSVIAKKETGWKIKQSTNGEPYLDFDYNDGEVTVMIFKDSSSDKWIASVGTGNFSFSSSSLEQVENYCVVKSREEFRFELPYPSPEQEKMIGY
jgi:hypothetical protein